MVKNLLKNWLGINQIKREMENMSVDLKEQERQLNEKLDGITSGVGLVRGKMEELLENLEVLRANTDINLDDEIARAEEIHAALGVISGSTGTPAEEVTAPAIASVEQQVQEALEGNDMETETKPVAGTEVADAEQPVEDNGTVTDQGQPAETTVEGTRTRGESEPSIMA